MMKSKKTEVMKTFKCAVLGHKWKGTSLRKECQRCNKIQVSRYSPD